jgi:hypothetical protein
MAQWQIVAQFDVDAATPEEARTFVAQQLRERLHPGEEESVWRSDPTELPRYRLASVREIRPDPGVPPRSEES